MFYLGNKFELGIIALGQEQDVRWMTWQWRFCQKYHSVYVLYEADSVRESNFCAKNWVRIDRIEKFALL